jgi:protein involved in polysaccharide export with SLBB domain
MEGADVRLPAGQHPRDPRPFERARFALPGGAEPESGTDRAVSRSADALRPGRRSTFPPVSSKEKGLLVELRRRPNMRTRSILALAVAIPVGLWSSCSAPSRASEPPAAPDFAALGDRVHVRASEPSWIAGWYAVDAEGEISLPRVGEVAVGGWIAEEIEELLEQSLAARCDERVELDVRIEALPKRYVTCGEVTREGAQVHAGDLTLFEAVVAAHPTEAADLGHVRVLRVDSRSRGGPEDWTIDLRPMFERGDSRMNIAIQPGDVILVPAVGGTTSESGR